MSLIVADLASSMHWTSLVGRHRQLFYTSVLYTASHVHTMMHIALVFQTSNSRMFFRKDGLVKHLQKFTTFGMGLWAFLASGPHFSCSVSYIIQTWTAVEGNVAIYC